MELIPITVFGIGMAIWFLAALILVVVPDPIIPGIKKLLSTLLLTGFGLLAVSTLVIML